MKDSLTTLILHIASINPKGLQCAGYVTQARISGYVQAEGQSLARHVHGILQVLCDAGVLLRVEDEKGKREYHLCTNVPIDAINRMKSAAQDAWPESSKSLPSKGVSNG